MTVPGSNGKLVRAASEDVRPAVDDDSFAKRIRGSNDERNENRHDLPTIDLPEANAATRPTATERSADATVHAANNTQ